MYTVKYVDCFLEQFKISILVLKKKISMIYRSKANLIPKVKEFISIFHDLIRGNLRS